MTTDTVGGVWSYTVELCKSLLPHNVEFHLVTTGAALKTDQKTEVYLLSNVTVYETDFLLEWMEDPWDNINASGEYLLQLEKKINPDIIHLNSYAYGGLGWKAPVVVVAHSDVYSWWQAVKKESPPTAWNTYYQKVKTGISDADYLIAPSDWMMTAIRKIYHVSVAGEVIYNGRNAGLFYQSEKQPFVFSMGRVWDEAKNISLLVAAAPGINCPVKIAGDNSFENNQIAAEGVNITYLGKLPLPEIAEVLSKAAVYVLPATYEP
ncbi:MAG: glycosyltransferase family 4 protein, partial [Segetibacter sp.]